MKVTLMSKTLWVERLTEVARRVVRLRKKTMNLCVYDSEQSKDGEKGEDVGIGRVRSREVAGAFGTKGEPRNDTHRNGNVNSTQI